MSSNPIDYGSNNPEVQYEENANFQTNNLVTSDNNNRMYKFSENIPLIFDSKSLEGRETKILNEAKEMRKIASKRSKTILAVGLVAGAIAGIVGGALALAGIVIMIPFIIAGISVFAGIIFSIASLPETEQMYEARLTIEYAKKALTDKDEEKKAEALLYLSKIIDDTKGTENESFYSEDRNNLLRLAVKDILDKNKEGIYGCLINGSKDVKSSAIALLTKAKIKDLSEKEKIIQRLFER